MAEECEKTPKRTALIAMDGSKYSEAALKWYVKNIHKQDDKVVIIHVVHHVAHYTMGSVWAPIDPQAITKAFEEETERGKHLCRSFEELLKKNELHGNVVQASGDPGHRIVEASEDCGANFIITGSRGLGTIRRTILGSVSDYIVHHAKVPVFIFNHREVKFHTSK